MSQPPSINPQRRDNFGVEEGLLDESPPVEAETRYSFRWVGIVVILAYITIAIVLGHYWLPVGEILVVGGMVAFAVAGVMKGRAARKTSVDLPLLGAVPFVMWDPPPTHLASGGDVGFPSHIGGPHGGGH
jgi:hypothetical protein